MIILKVGIKENIDGCRDTHEIDDNNQCKNTQEKDEMQVLYLNIVERGRELA